MIENFMDYTPDACMNLFTKDQVDRMHIVLEHSPRRNSLFTSHALIPVDPNQRITALEKEISNDISIYPNPVTSHKLIIKSKKWDEMNVHVFDVNGKIIRSKTGRRQMELHLIDVKQGIYIVRVFNDKTNLFRKIIINK